MGDIFYACTLPWEIWPWGITLTHGDTDMVSECSVEFGVGLALTIPPGADYPLPGSVQGRREGLWVRVDFELAAFASAKPHRDDEDLVTVSGYDIVPRRMEPGGESSWGLRGALRGVESVLNSWEQDQRTWLQTGACPDPGLYFSKDSAWLEAERSSWAARQRTSHGPQDAVHFLLDGRDGYVEVMALGFTWRAWHYGSPLLGDVSGDPVMSGRWIDGDVQTEGVSNPPAECCDAERRGESL